MVRWIVNAKKWFDKVNGNTYHSVRITDAKTNKPIYSSGMTYGYGDQYRHTAMDYLIKKGKMKENDRFNHEQNAKNLYFNEADVSRKGDLDLDTFDAYPDKDKAMKKHLSKKR
jgi:hypothetical protein